MAVQIVVDAMPIRVFFYASSITSHELDYYNLTPRWLRRSKDEQPATNSLFWKAQGAGGLLPLLMSHLVTDGTVL